MLKTLAEDSRYSIDTAGNVYSSALWGRRNRSGRSKPYKNSFKKLKAVPNKDGLLVVGIGTKIRFVHDLVLHTFKGKKPAGCVVQFIDQNPLNVSLVNLRYQPSADSAVQKLAKIGYDLEHVRKVPGYADYWATIHGEIISTKNREARILNAWKNQSGYLRLALSGRFFYVHRIVALAWLGPPPAPDSEVRHFPSKNKLDCRPFNLRWGEHEDNEMDKILQKSTKLTPEQVIDIRAQLVNGKTRTGIARDFGVSTSMISLIADGTCWKNYGMTPEFTLWMEKRKQT